MARDRDRLRPGRSGRAADHQLLGEAIDEVRTVHVPADIEADERDVAPTLDSDDLAEQDRGVLGQLVAGSDAIVTPSGPRCRASTAA